MNNEEQLNKYAKERNYYDDQNRQQASKDRLRQFLEGRIRTLFIGIISEFEKHLGVNWGHGELIDDCNDFELDNRAVWKLCRSKVLDSGNDAIRVMIKELENYTVELKKYNLVCKVKNKGD